MAEFIGRRVDVGLAKEASRGVGVAATYSLPKITFGFDDKAQVVRSGESAGNIGAGPSNSYVADVWAEGSLEGEIRDQSFGLILSALLGSVSSASFSGAYKHTYTLSNSNQHPSLSIHVQDPIGDLLFKLAMINSLEISINPGEIVKYVVEFMSKRSVGSSFTPSYSAENRFIGKHLTFKVAANSGALDAASALSIKNLTLRFEKNLFRDTPAGTLGPEDILNQHFSISGSFRLNYENRTQRDYMLDGTQRALRIDLVNSDITIGSTNPAFRLDLGIVDFEGWEPAKDNDAIVMETINFNALWDITNSRLFSDCYLVNEHAGTNY